MTAKRKIDLSVQRKNHHNSDDFFEEKSPKDFHFKMKKQNLSKPYSISEWFDDEELPPDLNVSY
ncbi:MAG: hypothetical protein RQ733_05400 [Methyloprofundus sp.]|nr:hypothetical protein [Methyloprofundus sp.]